MSTKGKARGDIVVLHAEKHRMPKYVKEFILARAPAFQRRHPNLKYPLTNMRYWRSFRANVFVHKSGVLLRIMVHSGLRLTLGTNHPLGYYMLNRWLVHRVVATVWKPNKKPNEKPIVNHKDGDKRNCCADNLEWCSNSHNILHARSTGLNPYNKPTQGMKIRGKRKGASEYYGVLFERARQKWVGQVRHNNVVYCRRRFDTELEAAQHYNNVCDLLRITEKPRNDLPRQKITRVTYRKGTRIRVLRMIGNGRHFFCVSEKRA